MASSKSEPVCVDQLGADVFDRNCPSRLVMDDVVSRWGTLALLALSEGSYRFNALRRRIDGVSEKMLSQSLQALERDGFVTREVQSTIPPRVEYSLTDLGQVVAARLRPLIETIEDAMPQINQARETHARAVSPPG